MTDPTTPSVSQLPPLPPELDEVAVLVRGEVEHYEANDFYYTADQMRQYARDHAESLRQECDAAQAESDGRRRALEQKAEELRAEWKRAETAEADRDAARRDAERYAWLRHGDNDEYVVRNSDGSPLPILDPDVANPFLLRNEKLDAAIDAAMSGGTGECNG